MINAKAVEAVPVALLCAALVMSMLASTAEERIA
jgi:hypothetical protein